MLTTSTTHQQGMFIVHLAGRIDAAAAKDLEQQCLQWIDSGEKQFIFDFSAVDYISSAALRVFLLVAKRLNSVDGKLRLCALNSTLRDVFDISGFSKLFTITANLQDALTA